MAKGIFQVPYGPDGSMLQKDHSIIFRDINHPRANAQGWFRVDPIWQPNTPFKEILTYKSMIKSDRNSVTWWFKDRFDRQFPMFTTDFDLLVRNCLLNKGVTEELEWAVAKRGTHYGIKVTTL